MNEGQVAGITVQERFRGIALVPWFGLVVLFATFLVLSFFGGMMMLVGLSAGKGSMADIGKLVGVLSSLNFARIDAFLDKSLVSGGFVFLVGCGLLAVLTAVVQRSVERTRLKRITVTPLLPGVRRAFVPCEEGIYAEWFRIRYTGSRWYSFHRWDTLVVDAFDAARSRITLRDGRTTLCLKAQSLPGEQSVYYDNLKQLVLSHLPAERQVPQHKPLSYNWVACAVLILFAVAASSIGLRYLDAHTAGKVGDSRCDICNVGFNWSYVRIVSADKVIHEYCELHGLAEAIVRPGTAIRSAAANIPAMARQEGFLKAAAKNSAAMYGIIVWWIYGCIVLFIASPKPRILDR